jgi:peptide/nickel transport system ATP-binding protein
MRLNAEKEKRPLLEVSGLSLDFATNRGVHRVLDDVSFTVESGETLGIVGESGSGKSVTALSIGRLIPSPPAQYSSGKILLNGEDVLSMGKTTLRSIRGRVVSYVFQEPGASLNPVMRIGSQLREMIRLHHPEISASDEAVRLLRLVGIPDPETRVQSYPHQLSGGMQQRVMIAIAIASRPQLLVADEPTTALDVTVQAQILDLLRSLKSELGMSLVLISHNLAVVGKMAGRLAVMYAGQIVEYGDAAEILRAPRHPYTRALVESIPTLGAGRDRLLSIPGTVPKPGAFPTGCRFHPRCFARRSDCSEKPPVLESTSPDWLARCPYWDQPIVRGESEKSA